MSHSVGRQHRLFYKFACEHVKGVPTRERRKRRNTKSKREGEKEREMNVDTKAWQDFTPFVGTVEDASKLTGRIQRGFQQEFGLELVSFMR